MNRPRLSYRVLNYFTYTISRIGMVVTVLVALSVICCVIKPSTSPLCLCVSIARADIPPPPTDLGPMVKGRNAGRLFLKFCRYKDYMCVERQAIVYGQVCSSDLARAMGTGQEGSLQGGMPDPSVYHYQGWRCETIDPNATPPEGKEGGP